MNALQSEVALKKADVPTKEAQVDYFWGTLK